MAKIIWQKRASRALDERLSYASAEFGVTTASSGIVRIADIWDTRVKPETLKRRIKLFLFTLSEKVFDKNAVTAVTFAATN